SSRCAAEVDSSRVMARATLVRSLARTASYSSSTLIRWRARRSISGAGGTMAPRSVPPVVLSVPRVSSRNSLSGILIYIQLKTEVRCQPGDQVDGGVGDDGARWVDGDGAVVVELLEVTRWDDATDGDQDVLTPQGGQFLLQLRQQRQVTGSQGGHAHHVDIGVHGGAGGLGRGL